VIQTLTPTPIATSPEAIEAELEQTIIEDFSAEMESISTDLNQL